MEKLIAMLFLGRDLAHRAHFETDSRSEHMALQGFYKAIVKKADKLAEVWMGYTQSKLDPIPLLENEFGDDPITFLEMQAAWIEDNAPAEPRFITNLIDDILAEYHSTLYQLRELK